MRIALSLVLLVVGIAVTAFALVLQLSPAAQPSIAPAPAVPAEGSRSLLVELETPGGSLPFELHIHDQESGGGRLVIGEEAIRIDAEHLDLQRATEADPRWSLEARFPHYDSVLALTGPYESMSGTWTKVRGVNEDGSPKIATLPATVRVFEGALFPRDTLTRGMGVDFTGRWSVDFESSDDPAVAEFRDEGEGKITGTFMTTTGDYRYLVGRADGNLLRLATFDGAHAFLFHARITGDGTLEGDFWSGDWWHETWTASRDDDAELPDAFAESVMVEGVELGELVFADLDGELVRLTDALNEQGGRARLVEIFGTWCPNCADAAQEIKRLKLEHGDELGVVALAFELTEDHERSARQIERYQQRHGLGADADDGAGAGWPILIAGVSDKADATERVRVLDKVRSYPTTLFLNERNEVVAIHTGFSGPATGEAYRQQQQRWETIIEGLLGIEPTGEGSSDAASETPGG